MAGQREYTPLNLQPAKELQGGGRQIFPNPDANTDFQRIFGRRKGKGHCNIPYGQPGDYYVDERGRTWGCENIRGDTYGWVEQTAGKNKIRVTPLEAGKRFQEDIDRLY